MFLKKLKIEQPHYWDKRFLSSISSLPSTLSLPGPSSPFPPSLCQSQWSSSGLFGFMWFRVRGCCCHPACCLLCIDWASWAWGIFLPSWVFRLICSRSFVIKSFQASCLLVWMLNYWRGGAWLLEELGVLRMPSWSLLIIWDPVIAGSCIPYTYPTSEWKIKTPTIVPHYSEVCAHRSFPLVPW